MTETAYALIAVVVTAGVAYFLIGWTSGSKLRKSVVDGIKARRDDIH